MGGSEALRALGIDAAALEREAFVVRIIGKALVLAGDDAGSREGEPFYGGGHTGTLYAVYDFLQDQLGCRWVWPGPTGEVVPRRQTVEVGELSVQETPQLVRRHFRTGVRAEARQFGLEHYPRYLQGELDDLYETLMQDERTWLKRMRMGKSDKPQYGHAITLSPADAGIEPGRPFRLTIMVHSPDRPGGLIGPVYVARPTQP